MDTRKFRPEAIALLATKTVDSAVRVITQTPVPLQKKYQHWNHEDISAFYRTKSRKIDSQNRHQNQDLSDTDRINSVIWGIYERHSTVLDDSTRVIPTTLLKQTIDEAFCVIGIDSKLDDRVVNQMANQSDENSYVGWGLFLKLVKSSFPSYFNGIEDGNERFRRSDLEATVRMSSKPTSADSDKSNRVVGKDPTASTVQVDNVFYHKDEVHTAVVESVRKENTENRRKSQSNISPRGFDGKKSSITIENEVGNEYTQRIRCSFSHGGNQNRTDQRRTRPYHYRNPVQTVDVRSEKHIPGMFFDSEDPPSYALPIESQKIAAIVHPEYSFAERWKKKKQLYDNRVQREEKNANRKQLMRDFEQFVNMVERNSIGDVLQKTRADVLNENKQIYNSTIKMKADSKERFEDWRQNTTAQKEYEGKVMNSIIHNSIKERDHVHRSELQEISDLRPKRITKLSSLSTAMIDNSKAKLLPKKLLKEYQQSILSERLATLAKLKSEAILNAARSDARITIKTIKGSDYFDEITPPVQSNTIRSVSKVKARMDNNQRHDQTPKMSTLKPEKIGDASFDQKFNVAYSEQFTDSIDDFLDEFSSLTTALNLSSSLENN